MDFSVLSKNLKTIGISVALFLGTIFILIAYNYIAFGEITLKSNKYNPAFPEEKSFLTSLSGDFIPGLDFLFTNFLNNEVWFNWELGGQNNIPGLFITSPILILSFFGFILFFKKFKKEAILFFLIFLINVLIAALHKTVLTRHIFTITPFLFLPILFIFKYFSEIKFKLIYYSFFALFIFLAGYSCYRVFYVTHTYWGRDITNILPFTKEFNIYLLFLLFMSTLTFFVFKIKSSLLKIKN